MSCSFKPGRAKARPTNSTSTDSLRSADKPVPAALALSGVHFRITDPDAGALGLASCALDQSESLVCLRAVFTPTEPGCATPRAGDVVALPDDQGNTVVFKVAFVHTPSVGHCRLNILSSQALQPGEALLVQLLTDPSQLDNK